MSDIKRVKNYKKSRQPKPPISAAEHRANCEYLVDSLLMPIVDKLRKSPADIQPVHETFEALLDEMRNGVKRQPTIIQTDNGDISKTVGTLNTKVISGGSEVSQEITLHNSGGAENSPENKFSQIELQILKQIETESRIELLKKII